MESLVGYGSDDDNETERYPYQQPSGSSGAPGGSRRRDDDTNYDDVNMDLSEESQESEPELPQAEDPPRRDSEESRSRSRDYERRDKRRESPRRDDARDKRERRDERKDDRNRSDRDRSRGYESSRRGLLGDRPQDRDRETKVPALMDVKTNIGEPHKSHDARDAVSPRFVDRDRRERGRERERSERDRERERDRDRHSRRSPDRRSRSRQDERSRSRGNYPPSGHSSGERRVTPPSGDYRPSSYKVNKKLEVMEKMGLQIKTPDGSMATAQQLRAAAAPGLPAGFHPAATTTNRILDQVQKRKLLWASKKTESTEAAKWSGATFSQDTDGKQANKFMRLMGIKDAAALKPENPEKVADPIKKQEELFQAMQAQYEVARATTHTMRGVGLGFQRSQ